VSRIRTIKPEFFKHERLFDAEKETGLPLRVAFAGLWTQCDREGRFEWRPRQLGTDILPYDLIDFSRVLDALATRGFVVRYRQGEREFGYIESWHRHQVINNRESASDLPDPTDCADVIDASSTRHPRVLDENPALQSGREGKGRGKEGNGAVLSTSTPAASKAKATRLSETWVLPKKMGEWALEQGLPRDRILIEANKMRDWSINAGRNGVKKDWFAAWRNWVQKAVDDQSQPRASPRQSNRPPTMLELNTQLLAEMENADARRQEDHGQLEPPAGNLPAVWER
jgi:hypothetical protein